MKEMIMVVGMFCAASLFAQSFNTTYSDPNGGYGRSVTTTFGNQTTTSHFNQYGMPAGSSTQYNNTFGQPQRANGFDAENNKPQNKECFTDKSKEES